MARAATASRPQAGRRIESRWAGSMKFVSNFLEMGEYASIAGSALLCDAVTSPEQRNGYLAQVEDEVRQTNQLGYLKKYLASQYHNPAGFTDSRPEANRKAFAAEQRNRFIQGQAHDIAVGADHLDHERSGDSLHGVAAGHCRWPDWQKEKY